jgi:hypothetical protein
VTKPSEEAHDTAAAAILVGWIMVGVLLLSAVLQVYEESLLNTFYPFGGGGGQFAFLRAIFPSPAFYDLLSWQTIVVLEVIPFLLFFYFAARMRVDLLRLSVPAVLTIGVVGVFLSVVQSVISLFQDNLSHLLLTGSWALPSTFGTESLETLLASFATLDGVISLFGLALRFVFLGTTGLAFGYFAGETPIQIVRKWLEADSEDKTRAEPEARTEPS